MLQPSTITIIPTFKCTSSCVNCCFGSNPHLKETLAVKKTLAYIEEAKETYPSLGLLVLTGGEVFLLQKNLKKIVTRAKDKKLLVRIVSNAFWAKSYQKAREVLLPLVDAGLSEINFSTGDNHLVFVPIENIVNGVAASIDLGITVAVSIEQHDSNPTSMKILTEHERMQPYLHHQKLLIMNSPWIPFQKNPSGITSSHKVKTLNSDSPCDSILRGIFINPSSQMVACCGLPVEYIPYLKLGSLESHSMKTLFEYQSYDFIKIWLHVDGPKIILDYLNNLTGKKTIERGHICHYCIDIFSSLEYLEFIRAISKEKINDVLFRYSLKLTMKC
jgi:hypothetical protein